MLVEVPIRFMKQDKSPIPGEVQLNDATSHIVIRVDEISSVGYMEGKSSSVELMNGTCYNVLLSYNEMITLWQNCLETMGLGGVFLATACVDTELIKSKSISMN